MDYQRMVELSASSQQHLIVLVNMRLEATVKQEASLTYSRMIISVFQNFWE
jgi:hypothetical protein